MEQRDGRYLSDGDPTRPLANGTLRSGHRLRAAAASLIFTGVTGCCFNYRSPIMWRPGVGSTVPATKTGPCISAAVFRRSVSIATLRSFVWNPLPAVSGMRDRLLAGDPVLQVPRRGRPARADRPAVEPRSLRPLPRRTAGRGASSSCPEPDVHGNQVGLLKASRCFQKSGSMTCGTCHDVHRVERDPAVLSTRCGVCHTASSCPTAAARGDSGRTGCVECHMPLAPSKLIEVQTYRTHRIAVYKR